MARGCVGAALLCLIVSSLTAEAATLAVYVKTDPTGADLAIDGTSRGTTPKVVMVDRETVIVTLTLPGYEEVTRVVHVTRGRLEELDVRMLPVGTAAPSDDAPSLGTAPATATAADADLEGKILYERWENMTRSELPARLDPGSPYYRAPDVTEYRSTFLAPTDAGDRFAARMSGYLNPPQTGDYTFWITSDDQSELWLSVDETPAGARRIAAMRSYALVDQWDKETGQKSRPIRLVAGRRYYIEAIHREGALDDCLAVGWTLPDGTIERPVPGSRLSAVSQTAVRASPSSEHGVEPGHGLTTTYYGDTTLTTVVAQKLAPMVDFDWATGSPQPGAVPQDGFSMRAEGFVVAPSDGEYTFVVVADDGARLYVDGKLVLDEWEDGQEREMRAPPVKLVKEAKTSIRLEYFENAGKAVVRLMWEAPGGAGVLPVPNRCLLPAVRNSPHSPPH